ncbi:ras-like GTP-binding protein RHO [Corticium candelabrum]|uniref:ras-like GTP-binding protein RHO n=1 Tax=Corticium candelabrum TaxID=121492 RepID=UPI002E26AEEE|nr:ras-like GTP-binding protein RHO [Corticium candelabrum]XP_062510385.1 ras-like GTP-binding protein RHO [Corticium candelabrum]
MKKKTCCVVLVGDQKCGKTSLCKAYLEGSWQKSTLGTTEYLPTIDATYKTNVEVGQKQIQMTIRDTSGQEAYDRLRPLSYTDCDVIAVCFDVGNPASLENVRVKWHPETIYCCPHSSTVLVGCKADARGTKRPGAATIVRKNECQQMAKTIGASDYVECSVLDESSLSHIFETIARVAKRQHKTKRTGWWRAVKRKIFSK